MSLWFRQRRKKNTAHARIASALWAGNRLLAERRASVDFKKPWDFVFEFKEKIEAGRGDLEYKTAPGGRDSVLLFANLALLDKIRTFFKENPDADF